MKKLSIFLLILFALTLFLLIVYIFYVARTPIISKVFELDKDIIIYEARNISPLKYCYDKVNILQYRGENGWIDIEKNEKFYVKDDILYLTGFGLGKNEFKVDLKEEYGKLRSGKYRIEKVFYREEKWGNKVTHSLYIYFDI